MANVEKPFAVLVGTNIVKHASETLPGERFEWNGYEVHPVLRKFFRFNRSGGGAHAQDPSINPRESAAHLVTKSLIERGIIINCSADGRGLLLKLRDVRLERQANNRTPDVVGTVDFCVPFWHLKGQKLYVEVHFENAVRDPRRVADLRALDAPVLEIHLDAKYLKKQYNVIDNPHQFRALIRALMTYGRMAGTWILPPVTAPAVPMRGAF